MLVKTLNGYGGRKPIVKVVPTPDMNPLEYVERLERYLIRHIEQGNHSSQPWNITPPHGYTSIFEGFLGREDMIFLCNMLRITESAFLYPKPESSNKPPIEFSFLTRVDESNIRYFAPGIIFGARTMIDRGDVRPERVSLNPFLSYPTEKYTRGDWLYHEDVLLSPDLEKFYGDDVEKINRNRGVHISRLEFLLKIGYTRTEDFAKRKDVMDTLFNYEFLQSDISRLAIFAAANSGPKTNRVRNQLAEWFDAFRRVFPPS